MKSLPYETIAISDRLRLTQLRPSDAERVFFLVESNREHLGAFLPWVKTTLQVSDSASFIDLMIERRTANEEYGYGIVYDDQIVGHASVMYLKSKPTPEIGYWIAKDHEGKGLMTMVAQAMTDFTLNTLGFDDVIIRAEPRNLGSNRVAEKCGYHRDGEIHDKGVLLNIWRKNK